jgi:hypothetical protein
MKKGPGHTIMVEGSHELSKQNRHYRISQIKEKVRRMGLPYTLYFYERGPGIVCYWDFRDIDKQEAKDWFDRNAAQGVYPEVHGLEMVKH